MTFRWCIRWWHHYSRNVQRYSRPIADSSVGYGTGRAGERCIHPSGRAVVPTSACRRLTSAIRAKGTARAHNFGNCPRAAKIPVRALNAFARLIAIGNTTSRALGSGHARPPLVTAARRQIVDWSGRGDNTLHHGPHASLHFREDRAGRRGRRCRFVDWSRRGDNALHGTLTNPINRSISIRAFIRRYHPRSWAICVSTARFTNRLGVQGYTPTSHTTLINPT